MYSISYIAKGRASYMAHMACLIGSFFDIRYANDDYHGITVLVN
jgi:hypothetical protein